MPDVDALDLGARISEILGRRAAVGLAVGVVRNGSLEFFYGHGRADIASRTPVTEDTVFRVGSITKTFTAIAVMQLEEQGLVDLDAPADQYLEAYRLIPADPGWRPVTARHLLTHTSGIGEVVHPTGVARQLFGETVPAGRPVPSPAEYYGRGLRVRAEPGTRFRYTDHGFATLGQLVEDVAGKPFDHYLRQHVFAPLGMGHTDLVRSDRVRFRLASGYDLRSGGPRPHPDYEVVTAGGAAAYSTTRDMGRYLAALLGGGSNEHGSVLEPATLATMFAPQYQPDPRVPGLGLAFFRGNAGGHALLEHLGVVPAFTSQICIAPGAGLGVMTFTNGARNGMFWLPIETEKLIRHLLGAPDEAIRTDVPHHPEIWADLCGWYSVAGPLTDVRARGMLGAGVEVFVRGGRLSFRTLTPVPALATGVPLHPDDPADPYAFRFELPGSGVTMPMVFGREPGGEVTAAHFVVMPLSAHKQPDSANPRRWVTGALVAGAVAVAVRRVRRHAA